jgi:uracil-DNA glycosylase
MKHDNLSHLVHSSWLTNASQAFDKFKLAVVPTLNEEAKTKVVFPAVHNIFRALKEVPFDRVRVVIIGQDPYHDAGSATGLAFDNPKSQKPSPSLRNILREIASDTGTPSKANENNLSYMEHLPGQGVLLLNSAFTVEEGKPGSHLAIWEPFFKELLTSLNKSHTPIVWVLWGKKAQAHKSLITNPKHHVMEGVHPSPFSARNGFFGGRFFTRINSLLNNAIVW